MEPTQATCPGMYESIVSKKAKESKVTSLFGESAIVMAEEDSITYFYAPEEEIRRQDEKLRILLLETMSDSLEGFVLCNGISIPEYETTPHQAFVVEFKRLQQVNLADAAGILKDLENWLKKMDRFSILAAVIKNHPTLVNKYCQTKNILRARGLLWRSR